MSIPYPPSSAIASATPASGGSAFPPSEGSSAWPHLAFTVADRFDAESEALRDAEYGRGRSARDAFDEPGRSRHIMARLDGRVIGLARVTRGPDCPLAQWGVGQLPVASSAETVAFTRGLVLEPYRRLGLFRLLMLECALTGIALGARTALAAVEPWRGTMGLFAALGFQAHTGEIFFHDAPRITPAVFLTSDLTARPIEAWHQVGRTWQQRTAAAGYRVTSAWAEAAPAEPPVIHPG